MNTPDAAVIGLAVLAAATVLALALGPVLRNRREQDTRPYDEDGA